jgi:transposase
MNESIADSLTKTITAPKRLELPAQVLEFSIDQVLDAGLLKDIPLVGWIAKGYSTVKSISDTIFLNKIVRFLFTLEKLDTEEREACRIRMRDDNQYRRRVGEHLILILDKLDNLQKAEILAKCFKFFLDGDIDHDRFMDLAHVVERASLADLRALSVPASQRITFRDRGLAATSGILVYDLTETWDAEQKPELTTRLSKLGADLRAILLGICDGNLRWAAALAGVAPMNCDSGKIRGHRRIQGGRGEIRQAMYMATIVACRYEPTLKEFYQRLLANGKAKKIAITAVMRKLILHLNSLMRNHLQSLETH